MEPEGGEYSGVVVNTLPSQSAGLAVGDLIDIEGGFKDEFACSGDICGGAMDTTGRTITQITGSTLSLTKVGDGQVPAPELLDPRDLAANDAEAEKWEGVLVQFDDVSVNSPPAGVSSTDPLLTEMRITGPFRVSASLTELTQSRDDCLASVVGIGDYFFEYKILPRSAADIVGDGTGCPPQETGDTDCGDLADNDADGFMDCGDFSCQDTVASCVESTDIVAIRDGTVGLNSAVMLDDVYVVAVAFNKKNLWVSDNPAAAQNEGIFVFRGFGSTPEVDAQIVAGTRVDVVGVVDEYNGLLQVEADPDGGVTFASAGSAATAITGVGVGTLINEADGEPYEGSLVTITDVELDMKMMYYQFSVTDGTDSIVTDDDIYRYLGLPSGSERHCFASITGIVHADSNSTADPAPRILLPLSEDDVVTETCPP
jgi:hypothetical protein